MDCVLTALGSYGDVHPMIGLGVALRRRGHEVTLVTNPYFEDEVAAAGLTMAPLSTAEEYERLTRHPDLWNPGKSLGVVFREGAIACLEELYSLLSERCRPGETMIAAHGLDLSSRVVAETLGVPVASVVYAPLVMPSDRSPARLPVGLPPRWTPPWLSRFQRWAGERLVVRPLITKPLERFRAGLGLPPMQGGYLEWYYGAAPPLCLFPEWFAPPPGDWPDGTTQTGFPLWDRVDPTLDDGVEEFLSAGSPPIVFTPGSANRDARGFFSAAVDACQRLGRRGVLLTKYAEQVPDALPESVRWFGFAPLGKVLERAAAFVHHGGIGSSAQGMAAGVPQLIRPLAFDQFDNALRLRRLGVADELPRRRFTGPAAAGAIGRLLASETTRAACGRVAGLCDRDAALELTCDELERRFDASLAPSDRE